MRRMRRRAAMMMAARETEGKQALEEEASQWLWMAMAGVWEMGRGWGDEVQVWGDVGWGGS